MNRKIHVAILVAAFAVAIASFSMARTSRGQSPNPKPKSPVRPTVLITSNTASSTVTGAPSVFSEAATRNAVLKNELVWTFGGKRQRGWSLYDLLIRETLKTPHDSDSAEFAEAVADWQRRIGLNPSGVLEEESFMALVSQWQGSRLKSRTLAQVDQLQTLPATDFYDPERVAELRQVERNAYAAYKEMIAAAMTDLALNLSSENKDPNSQKYFKIISSFRTPEYQERLRRASPNAGRAGLAINSPHFTGRALDIYVGGDPVDTRDSNRAIQVSSPAYQWLVHNAERFGFRPYFYEPWHWEYVR